MLLREYYSTLKGYNKIFNFLTFFNKVEKEGKRGVFFIKILKKTHYFPFFFIILTHNVDFWPKGKMERPSRSPRSSRRSQTCYLANVLGPVDRR